MFDGPELVLAMLIGFVACVSLFSWQPHLVGLLIDHQFATLQSDDNKQFHLFPGCKHGPVKCRCRCLFCHHTMEDIVGDCKVQDGNKE